MNLAQILLNQIGGEQMNKIAGQFGIESDQANNVIGKVLPFLSGAISKNVSQEGGLQALIGALTKGEHSKYLNTEEAVSEAGINDGNNILGHILGSKDVSRNVASHAANETGIDVGVVKKMLPVIASMVMGAMSKESQSGGVLSQLLSLNSGGSDTSSLMKMLDFDKDGSAVDDILGLAKRLF